MAGLQKQSVTHYTRGTPMIGVKKAHKVKKGWTQRREKGGPNSLENKQVAGLSEKIQQT